jgi:MscS family membrane protein
MWDFLGIVFWNNTLQEWLLGIAWMAGGFAAGKVCSAVMAFVLRRFCGKTRHRIDDIIVLALARPLSILIFLKGLSLGLTRLHLHEGIELWADRVLGALFIGILAWGIDRALEGFILRYVPGKNAGGAGEKETALQPVLRKLFKTLVWIIAGALVLKALGYNINALMAGLGLGGAAVALASKDTLANFFGSITVFVDRPFRINDRIKITGYDGVITDMGIRTSRLRTAENRTVIIPNSVFAANPIENISAAPHTTVSQTINLKRDMGIEKISRGLALIEEVCSGTEGTCGVPSAGIVSVGAAACQVNFVYYTAKHADYLGTVNRVNLALLRRFEEAGILLA